MAESETSASIAESRGDDGHLAAGLRAGERWAHAELCRRLGPPVHRFIWNRLSGDEQTAEDLMIQTLADAARNIGHYDERKASLRAWVFGIARRQILLERRRRARRKAVPEEAKVPLSQVSEMAAQLNLADSAAARLDARRQVAELAACLSDAEMEALKLHHVYGFSVEEVAHITSRSRRAADSLLHRARQKARERLARDE